MIWRLGKFWILLLFLVGAVYFCVNNREPIAVDLSPFTAVPLQVPAFAVFLISFLAGASIVILFFGVELTRRSWEIRKLKKALGGFQMLSDPKLQEID